MGRVTFNWIRVGFVNFLLVFLNFEESSNWLDTWTVIHQHITFTPICPIGLIAYWLNNRPIYMACVANKFGMGYSLLSIFAWFWRHSSLDSQNYYIAIWVERQVWFGDTVQISLVWESTELCLQNRAKIINSVYTMLLIHWHKRGRLLKTFSSFYTCVNDCHNYEMEQKWSTDNMIIYFEIALYLLAAISHFYLHLLPIFLCKNFALMVVFDPIVNSD